MTSTATTQGGGIMRIPRSRGALSGLLLIALGLWGALVPFVGPYFDFGYTDATWQWTWGRFWLEVLPGAAAVLGGLMLLGTANRASAALGGWLASAAGGWFILGPVVWPLWADLAADVGVPQGGGHHQVWENIALFPGLGAVILFLGAHAAGRVTVRSVRDLKAGERHADEPARRSPAEEHRPAESRRDAETRAAEPRVAEPRAAESRPGRAAPQRIEPRGESGGGSGRGGGATAMDDRSR